MRPRLSSQRLRGDQNGSGDRAASLVHRWSVGCSRTVSEFGCWSEGDPTEAVRAARSGDHKPCGLVQPPSDNRMITLRPNLDGVPYRLGADCEVHRPTHGRIAPRAPVCQLARSPPSETW
jgi:hypothetical protein